MIVLRNKDHNHVVRCINCKSIEIITLSLRKGDDSINALVMCDECGANWNIVISYSELHHDFHNDFSGTLWGSLIKDEKKMSDSLP